MGSELSKSKKVPTGKKSLSRQYYASQLRGQKWRKYKLIIIAVLAIAILITVVLTIRNDFEDFVNEAGFGIWGYIVPLTYTYPFLRPIWFVNSETPTLTLQMFYWCEQVGPECSQGLGGCCAPGIPGLVMNPSAGGGDPRKCLSASECNTALLICEGDPDIVAWYDPNNIPASLIPIMQNLHPNNFPQIPQPSAPPSISTIFSYVLPVIMIAGMIIGI